MSKSESKAQKMRQELLGRNPNYIQRYPEDLLHDEFEAGQAVSWTVIGISVPEHTIDNDFYGEVRSETRLSLCCRLTTWILLIG